MHIILRPRPMTGLDPFSSEIVKSIASLVVKTAWEMANKPLDKKIESIIYNASHQYFHNYTNRHGIIKVLGMSEPVPLEDVYINAQLLDGWLPTNIDSMGNVDAKYRRKKQRRFGFGEYKKRSGIQMANQHQYLMVLGEPGMGKSTFLKKTGLDALRGSQKNTLNQHGRYSTEEPRDNIFAHACLPVFIELKLFKSENTDIEELIVEEFKICGFPKYQETTKIHLEKGKLLILLDGLDEVPSNLMIHVIKKIQDFVDRHPKNRFIVSCRRAAYHFNFRRFNDVFIADFEDKQIHNFIVNWFYTKPEVGKECWQNLNSAEYEPAKELTHTPLLLTLICLLYDRAGQFPTNRSTLYNRALRVLLEEWAAEKSLPQEQIYRGLDTRRKELMLSKIAHDAFRQDLLFLNRRDIATQIEQLLSQILPEEKSIDGDKILKSIEMQHGIFVERAMDVYSFSHLTLQEFLTAQYIADDNEKISWLIANHLISDHWHEVFLLIAGLKQQTDDFLLQIERRTQVYCTNNQKLQSLLGWSTKVTQSSPGTDKLVAKQAMAIALALDCTRALKFTLAIAQSRETIRKLILTIKLNHPASKNSINRLVSKFEQELHRALVTSRGFGLARDQAHLLARKFGCSHNLALKIELGHGLEFEQLRKLVHTLEPTHISELVISLNKARMYVFQNILRSVIAENFVNMKIFSDIKLYGLSLKLENLKKNIPRGDQPFEIQEAFIKEVQRTWFEALMINPELVGLESNDLEILEAYLKANKLLTSCYGSAVWVKPITWEGIEKRMLKGITT